MSLPKEIPFEERSVMAKRLLEKFPDQIPVIMKPGSKTTPSLSKYKYLIPKNYTTARLMLEIRKHLTLKSEQSLFIFVGNSLLPSGEGMSQIYSRLKDPDGFLYVTYALENTFG